MTAPHARADADLAPLIEARTHDPFARLGWHARGAGWRYTTLAPHAEQVELWLDGAWCSLERVGETAVFGLDTARRGAPPPRLRLVEGGVAREAVDAYGFAPALPPADLWLFNAGRARQAWRALGAHVLTRDGVAGVRFTAWAPNAERVSVVGAFNRWDGRAHMMSVHGSSGVWELFIPGVEPGARYRFELRSRDGGRLLAKADPWARQFEPRPGTAAEVVAPSAHAWRDGDWMAQRARADWLHAPMLVYEVHAGSWMRHADGRYYSYDELAARLVPYARDMGYTHLELLPLTEHPLDESWGYQTTGYFAPTRRHGDADGLRRLVDAAHGAGLGVILDWVPGHFPRDDWALARFDGTALFEHEDERLGIHPDWGTHTFNFGRNEVRSFLLSSAHYWLSEFHVDALRVDAVASMLYLDYSRRPGEWLPNRFGGRENLEAIDFLRELNEMVHGEFSGALTIAEESTAWPMVSRPTWVGGLGFSMKWNMGWMHDTLAYLGRDPAHRRYHHEELTFGQLYAYTENFVLPLSHDEVVHGKGSLLAKMPGDDWQRFANLRLLSLYQAVSPGRKLGFMGNEIAQAGEWDVRRELDWGGLADPRRAGLQRLARDLNHLVRAQPALYELDFESAGFAWIDCQNAEQSVISFLRRARDGGFVVCVINFTPVPRPGHVVAVPRGGRYRELLNSDASGYGGSNIGNAGEVRAHGPEEGPARLVLDLPPLAGLVLQPA